MYYGNDAVLLNKSGNSKSIRLLQMLLLSMKGGIPKRELMDNLYEWNENADTANRNKNLNNLIYRLKGQLVSGGLPDDEYVELSEGMCCFKSRVSVELDIQQFEDAVEKAKQYIKARFREDVSLEKTAREVGISPYYLSKLFKETEGSSYIDYLTALRIDYAKENLADREKSIKEICAGSGYREPNYFSSNIKKWTGLTPTEYRESLDRKDMKDEDR